MDDVTLELAVDTAAFYNELRSRGVSEAAAAAITSAFVSAVVMCPANYAEPDDSEPWRAS